MLLPTMVAAERRSFACMRRLIHTFVHRSMKEDTLSALSNINIADDLAQKIDCDAGD
jgi:hypothetical protein